MWAGIGRWEVSEDVAEGEERLVRDMGSGRGGAEERRWMREWRDWVISGSVGR